MHRSTTLLAVPLALLAVSGVVATSASAAAPGVVATRLTGAAEVPGPGDPDGMGLAKVLARPDQSSVCITVDYKRITIPVGAHIHEGAATIAGPIVVDFTPLIAGSPKGSFRGCVDTTPELAADIAANPGDYYVNLHTEKFPSGAIRGQLPAG